MISLPCTCSLKRKRRRHERQRLQYGIANCDTTDLDHHLALLISNALNLYVANAEGQIVRKDFEAIRKHAKVFEEYAGADAWYSVHPKKMYSVTWPDFTAEEKKEALDAYMDYRTKYKDFVEAMKWMEENWKSLWW